MSVAEGKEVISTSDKISIRRRNVYEIEFNVRRDRRVRVRVELYVLLERYPFSSVSLFTFRSELFSYFPEVSYIFY